MKELVKRYIMRKQLRNLNAGVTEDDINEIKQDISGLRYKNKRIRLLRREMRPFFRENSVNVHVNVNGYISTQV